MFSQSEVDALLENAEAVAGPAAGEEEGSLVFSSDYGEVRAEPGSVPMIGGSGSSQLNRVLKLRVPVVVRLAQRNMSIEAIRRLGSGTILEFERTVDCELDLMVNNRQIGKGVAVKVGENFGLRLTYVGNIRERIASLGA